MKFSETHFDERILRAVDELGFLECTPVQEETFKLVQEGRDVLAQSQTGTGKTAAFLISGFHLLLNDEKYQGKKMLVLAPTRELADQIEKDAHQIGKHLPLRIASFYGGVGYGHQEKMLQEGVEVLIGTPGRILDYVNSRKLILKDIGILVIDEADRMFDMGFLPDIRRILKGLNPPDRRRTFLFSATLNSQVGYLAWEYMHDPGEVLIEPEKVSVQNINQELFHVSHDEKMPLLLGILKKYQARNAVFFVNTKHSAIRLAKRLTANGYAADYLIGDMPQSQRLRVIQRFKENALSWLVATDVAARGLHIEDLDLVVNYDLPLESETYVHRIGRTARAGKSGRAVSLACEKYVYGLKGIEDLLGFKIPVQWLDEAEWVEDKSAGRDWGAEEEPRKGHGRNDRRHTGERHNRDGGGREKKKVVSQLISQITGSRESSHRDSHKIGGSPKNRTPQKSAAPAPGATASLEDKLAYYRKKYGSEFEKAREADRAAVGKPSDTPAKSRDIEAENTSAEKKDSRKKRHNRRARKKKGLSKVPIDEKMEKESLTAAVVSKKPGFFQRLFRFLTGKKEN